MSAPDRLAAFLDVEAARAFRMGVHDCWLFPADWVRCRTGRDPAAAWRGRYQSMRGAARLIRGGGGAEAFAGAGLNESGWVPSRRIRRGQVGLVPAQVLIGATDANAVRIDLIGAIALGGGWWVSRSGAGGLMMGPAVPVAVWRPG